MSVGSSPARCAIFPKPRRCLRFRPRPASLLVTRRLATMARDFLLCHGLGEHDMARMKPWDEGYALEYNFELELLYRDGDKVAAAS